MQVIVAKIQERSPLKYSKVKALSSLCPSLIWSDAKESVKRFKSLCNALLDTNRITTTVADKALRQWETLVQSGDCKSRVKEFGNLANADPNKRLDIFFRGLLNQKDEFKELYTIVKMVLILSHGSAEVERGFSVNKLVLNTLSILSAISASGNLVHGPSDLGGSFGRRVPSMFFCFLRP